MFFKKVVKYIDSKKAHLRSEYSNDITFVVTKYSVLHGKIYLRGIKDIINGLL